MFVDRLFSDRLKVAVIVPIHNKGNWQSNDPSNYRPISTSDEASIDCGMPFLFLLFLGIFKVLI